MRRYRSRNRIERLLAVARAEIVIKNKALISQNMGHGLVLMVNLGVPCSIIPRTPSCIDGVNWFQQRGLWGNTPKVGAIIYFGNGYPTHVGIVEIVDTSN